MNIKDEFMKDYLKSYKELGYKRKDFVNGKKGKKVSEKDDITNKISKKFAQLKEKGDSMAIFIEEMLDCRTRQGPWNNEPDELNFIDEATGLECQILRIPTFGHLCGYVIIPEEQRKSVNHIGIDSPNIDVHGGITYAEYNDRIGNKYCIGFDCANYNDFVPFISYFNEIESYKDIEFVKAECIKLARQLKDLIDESKIFICLLKDGTWIITDTKSMEEEDVAMITIPLSDDVVTMEEIIKSIAEDFPEAPPIKEIEERRRRYHGHGVTYFF